MKLKKIKAGGSGKSAMHPKATDGINKKMTQVKMPKKGKSSY